MTAAELLLPRYEIIAEFPRSGYNVGSTLNKRTYKQLIDEDIQSVKEYFPKHSLEKDHIVKVLDWSVDAFYEGEGIHEHAKRQLLHDAYIEGYRKANITAGIIHGDKEERVSIQEFYNWYENTHKNGLDNNN